MTADPDGYAESASAGAVGTDSSAVPIGTPQAQATEPPESRYWQLTGIFLILVFAAIAAAREFLLPVTMSVLLFFVFMPVQRKLSRRGIPAGVTAMLVTLGLVGLMGIVGTVVTGPAQQLITELPQISRQLERKFEAVRGQFKGLDAAATTIGGTGKTAGGEAAMVPEAGTSVMMSALTLTPTLIGQLFFVLVLLFFMITSGDLMYLKIVQSFDTIRDKRLAYQALRQIEESLGSYLGTISVINSCLGIVVGLVLWQLGMPAPGLFGLAAMLLNFIPYVGAIMGISIATAVALVSSDGFSLALLVAASYVAITAVEGQFITPYFLSRRLELNTVVVFVAVALWAWLWSIVGMIVAVPILVVVRVLCEHIPGLTKIANFLAGETPPPPVPEEPAAPVAAETSAMQPLAG